jgi:hypothetical protein
MFFFILIFFFFPWCVVELLIWARYLKFNSPLPSIFFLFSNFLPGRNFDGYRNSVRKTQFPGDGVYPHVVQPTLDKKIKDEGWNKTEIRFN